MPRIGLPRLKGIGYTCGMFSCEYIAHVFPYEKIVVLLTRQLNWVHLIAVISMSHHRQENFRCDSRRLRHLGCGVAGGVPRREEYRRECLFHLHEGTG